MTIVAALIAAVTALIIAFFAYPWQKRKDRELKIHNEKLIAYRKFVSAVTEHHLLLGISSSGNITHETILAVSPQFLAAGYELLLYAPKEVAIECQKYHAAVLDYHFHTLANLGLESYERVRKAHATRVDAAKTAQRVRRSAILAIRADVMEESSAASTEVINAYFVATPIEENLK